MIIDVLYIEDCPSWQTGVANLKAALAAENIIIEINTILVKDDAKARQLKFLGSPSFQTNGSDLWPEKRENYNLSCRVYSTPAGMRGAPTVEMLREKIRTLNINHNQ